VCWLHGGKAPQTKAAAARRLELEEAEAACQKFGVPIDRSATESLVAEKSRTDGIVAWLMTQLGQMDPGDYTWGRKAQTVKLGALGQQGQGQPAVETTQAAGLHPLITWLLTERKHLGQIAAEMARLSIEDRAVRVTEAEADLVARILEATLADPQLDLSQDKQRQALDGLSRRFGDLALVPSA
jgi:hypothetical protein